MSAVPQVTRTVQTAIGTSGDLQLSDIQGVFRGRGLRVRDEGHSADTEIAFADDQSSPKDASLDPKQSSAAKPRANSRAEQRRNRQLLTGKLPDFEEDLPAFEAFLGTLRRAQKDRDYGNLKFRSGKLFLDPSIQHGALEAAAAILDEEGGDPSLTKELRQAAEELLNERGQEIQAGYNVSTVAAERTGGSPSDIRDLRDFYREAVFGYRTPLGTYEFIIDHAPASIVSPDRKEAASLSPQERKVEGSIDFLLHCLSADLESGEPSRDSVFLKAVNDGIRNVGFLTNSQQVCRAFLEKYNKETGGAVPVEPVSLLRTTLRNAENEQAGPQDYLSITEQFNVPHDSLRINFMTQLQGIVRSLPARVLPTENHRQQALQAMQTCLDSLIEGEFEEANHG